MNSTRNITEFLVCNLIVDNPGVINPRFINDSNVWDLDPELEVHWSILHWKTQAQVCLEIRDALRECCFD